eukprot:183724_1
MKHLCIDNCHIDTTSDLLTPSNVNIVSPSSLFTPISPYTPSSANNDNHLKFKLPLKPTPSKSFSKGSSKRSKKKPKSTADKFASEFYKNAKVKSVMAGHGIIGQFEARLMLAYYRNVDVENIEDSDIALTYLEHKSVRHLKRTLTAMDETIRRTFLYGSDYTHFHQQHLSNDNSEVTKQIEKQNKQTPNHSTNSVFDPLKGAQNVVLKPKNALNFKKNFELNKKHYITHSDDNLSHNSIWTESRTNSMDINHANVGRVTDQYVLTELNSDSESMNFVNYDIDNANANSVSPMHLAIPTPIINITKKLSLSPHVSLTASVSLESDKNSIVKSEMDVMEQKENNKVPKPNPFKQKSVSVDFDCIYRIDSLLLDQDNIPPMKCYCSVDSTVLNEMELPSSIDPSLTAAERLKYHLNEPRLPPARRKTYNY